MRALPWRGTMLGIAAACVVAVGIALVAQHRFDMQPCPWCILQRLIYLAIALVAIIAAWAAPRRARRGLGALVFVLAACGAAAAVWQHVVAAQQFSCNLTLADRVITVLRLETLVPPLFQVTASCAEAAASLLGVPFELWSLLLFASLGLAAFALARRPASR
jgi:disulfide bond formation protein DsbB